MTSTLPASLADLDQHAFTDLVTPYQPELRAHCYRMLGSLPDADDQVQETFWRAWDRRATYAGRAPVRAWLYRIATNACLDQLRRQPRRGLPIIRQAAANPADPIPPAITEPIWLEPYPAELPGPAADNPEAKYSLKESVQLAFLTALHLLPPRQRAVLLLADVLDWPAAAIADALDQNVPAVKSALHRARATLTQHYSADRRAALALPVDDADLRDRLQRYVRAWETADVDGLVALLKDDCSFSMPPVPTWYVGRANVAALVAVTVFAGPAAGRWRLLPTRANESVGFGLYRRNDSGSAYDAYGIQVVTFAGPAIADITTFRVPTLVPRFGLPAMLPA